MANLQPIPQTPIRDNPREDAIWKTFLQSWQQTITPLGPGTVTSVALSLPTSVFDVSGSPITTSGTFAVTLDTQSANTAFMGPTSGGAATPAFRALVPADIPAATPLTVGTTPIVSGTASRLLYEGAGNLLAESANLTFDGTILTVTGVVSVPDGTAAAPSIKVGDEQNGWYSSGANEIGGALNGTQYITFSTSQLTHSGATGGATKSIGVTNTSNTANASAAFFSIVGGASAGDAYSRYTVTGVGSWAAGIDNSDSDSYKISRSTAPGTNDFLTLTTSGNLTISGSITSSVLTSGRLALVGTAGLITDDAGITYDAAANSITATTFNGALNGNATTATTATTATNVTVANEATDTSCFILFSTAATGDLGPKSNANMTFNSSTGVVTFASAVLTTADINGGTVDNATIGGTTPAAGTFTDLTANGNTTLGSDAADSVTVNAESVTLPNVPSFAAYVSTNINNVTGAGTAYTVIYDSERYDQSSDFNTTTGTFTASVSGKYNLLAQVRVINIPAGATSAFISIVTSNATWTTSTGMAFVAGTFTSFPFQEFAHADMDAGDTATITIQVSAGAGDTADIAGSASMITFFTGRLVG